MYYMPVYEASKISVMGEETLELIRNKNIQRNKELLSKLNIHEAYNAISPPPKIGKSSKKSKERVTKPSLVPIRRSRRLANTPENDEEIKKEQEDQEKARLENERLRDARSRLLSGDFYLLDLLSDIRLGYLRYEDRVLGKNIKKDTVTEVEDTEKHDLDEKLKVLASIEQNIRRSSSETESLTSTDITPKKKKIEELQFFNGQDPSKLKLTLLRITCLHFHLSTNDRLVFGGDTSGNIGIWSVDQTMEEDEPLIITFKPHGKSVSKFCEIPHNQSQVLSSSYDGSIRITDLAKQQSIDILSLDDSDGEAIGVSDTCMPSGQPSLLYCTTLDGRLYQFDMREKRRIHNTQKMMRLHDKKIGGFSVNPNREYQIATSSLDRSLRLWDLRNVSKRNSLSELDNDTASPHFYGGYSSRLSISIVDWNSENHLVCNGYDNTIRLFDLSGNSKTSNVNDWKKDFALHRGHTGGDITYAMKPFKSISHNCQTGRWVSILKARWQKDPQDGIQKFVIGNMNRSFDIYTQEGSLIAQLFEPEFMTAVPSVVSFHPTHNWIVGGTSAGKVYLYT